MLRTGSDVAMVQQVTACLASSVDFLGWINGATFCKYKNAVHLFVFSVIYCGFNPYPANVENRVSS